MTFRYALIGSLASALLITACGTKITVKRVDDDPSTSEATSVSVTQGSGAATSTSVSSSVGVGGAGAACEDMVFEPQHPMKPIDAIFVVENDFQMSTALYTLEQQLHPSFAAVLDQAGADSQIIVLSDHGPSTFELCIPPPLSSTSSCNGAPGNVANQFRQFSTQITWGQMLCKVLSTLQGNQADEFGVQSWVPWLRPEALKAFVTVGATGTWCQYENLTLSDGGDINMGQQVALAWDSALLNLAPGQFGTSSSRNYLIESFVGAVPKMNFEPYYPDESVQVASCNGMDVGTGVQWLSKGTNALRAATCDSNNFSAMLPQAAGDIIRSASDRCTIHIPDPPMGQSWTFEAIEVIYTPDNSGPSQTWTRVDGPSFCGPGKFYIDGGDVVLCPDSCNTINADRYGEMQLVLRCVTEI